MGKRVELHLQTAWCDHRQLTTFTDEMFNLCFAFISASEERQEEGGGSILGLTLGAA